MTPWRPSVVSASDRTPPFDLESEAAVVSACLVDATAVDQVADMLKPSHFYSEAHRRIYEAILAVQAAGQTPDNVLVATWLRDQKRLEQVGGMAYIAEVTNAAPATTRVRAYAEAVFDKWLARSAITVCQRYVGYGYAYAENGSAADYVNLVARDISELATANSSVTTQMIGAIVRDNLRQAQEATREGRSIVGIPTGFTRYDRLTSGLHDGELTILAARPSMGKTSLAMNIVTNVASAPAGADEWRTGALFFSLEMPRSQVGMRVLCSEARVDVSRMRTGMLTPSDWNRLTATTVVVDALPMWVDDQSALSIVELRAKCRRAIAEATTKKIRIRLIAVDYLQLMSGSGQSEQEQVSGISRGLKQLAKELNLPVLALSQLNRSVETRGENSKRPQLSDLRSSGAIEQDADNVVFIYRDDYYNKESNDRGVAELIIAKQRSGPTDTVKVRFDPQYTRFDNLADGEYQEPRYGD